MQKLIRTFLFISILLLCGCTSGKIKFEINLRDKDIFAKDLSEIYDQQYSIRRSQWLTLLQNEARSANTLSSLNELELMLENPDYDNTIKNQNLMQHFERASLYMQILLFPAEREYFLQKRIKNELTFELSLILLNNTIAQNAITKLSEHPQAQAALRNSWQNIISNRKIEYDTLRINEFNTAAKIPQITYPLNSVPHFRSLENFRKYKYSPAHNAALAVYPQLTEKFGEKLPLTLLKLMYKTPYELNNHYSNDVQLIKDFSHFLQSLVWLWQSEQLYNNMQNSFVIMQEFQNALSNSKNASPEMLDGCFKTQLAYELAHLKMLAKINASPFAKLPLPATPPQLSNSRLETLQLILNELIKSI